MKRPDDRDTWAANASSDDDLSGERTRLPIARPGSCSRTIHAIQGTSDELVWLFDLLTDAGFHVATFSNPFEALDSVARACPAVVVADSHLPDMDGLELVARIKGISPLTRVILTTSSADRPAYQEVLETGAETLIHKPFESGVLLSAIERALNNVRGNRA